MFCKTPQLAAINRELNKKKFWGATKPTWQWALSLNKRLVIKIAAWVLNNLGHFDDTVKKTTEKFTNAKASYLCDCYKLRNMKNINHSQHQMWFKSTKQCINNLIVQK